MLIPSSCGNRGLRSAVDLHGAFTVPTDAGIAGEISIQHRAVVDVAAVSSPEALLELGTEALEPLLDEEAINRRLDFLRRHKLAVFRE